jgi:hypothetical protein
MITEETFLRMRKNWGHRASWAVWVDSDGSRPKSNLRWRDLVATTSESKVLQILNPNVIFVGLNGAKHDPLNVNPEKDPYWGNFHSSYSRGHDYKIRFAFKNTPYWGAYMTDIIEWPNETNANVPLNTWKSDSGFRRENIERFRKELSDLGATKPLLIALGGATYKILSDYRAEILRGNTGSVVEIRHFSDFRLNKEEYRAECLERLRGL